MQIASIEKMPRPLLIGMAKSIARTIDAGEIVDSEGRDLHDLLEEVFTHIPDAPDQQGTRR